jgi:glycosyltransferase involved in cell wall biosynthesis
VSVEAIGVTKRFGGVHALEDSGPKLATSVDASVDWSAIVTQMDKGAPAVVATAVIPVWEAYVDRLPAAIAALREANGALRILVVDNASRAPIRVPEGVDLLRLEHRVTLGAARSAGLAAASTPWVMFWDADDTAVPGSIVRLLEHARGAPSGVSAIVGGIVDARTGATHHWPRPWAFRLNGRPPLFLVMHAISSLFPTVGGSVLRRDALSHGGGFPDSETGDDWVAGLSLAARGRIVFDPRPARRYGRDAGSVSANWTSRHLVMHGGLVRQRLADDPAAPRVTAPLLPLIAAAQWVVVFVLRPISIRLHRRRTT